MFTVCLGTPRSNAGKFTSSGVVTVDVVVLTMPRSLRVARTTGFGTPTPIIEQAQYVA
jgi:hypothetical protein